MQVKFAQDNNIDTNATLHSLTSIITVGTVTLARITLLSQDNGKAQLRAFQNIRLF